jgi:hypothetical protein
MSNSWWNNKLGNTGQPQQPSYPSQTVPYQAPQQQVPQPAAPQSQPGQRLPQSATSYQRCPNCSSGNYGKMPGMPEIESRCYDCGYPRIQSGTGMPGMHVSSNGNTVAATQISTANNFNPGTIIGKIG